MEASYNEGFAFKYAGGIYCEVDFDDGRLDRFRVLVREDTGACWFYICIDYAAVFENYEEAA